MMHLQSWENRVKTLLGLFALERLKNQIETVCINFKLDYSSWRWSEMTVQDVLLPLSNETFSILERTLFSEPFKCKEQSTNEKRSKRPHIHLGRWLNQLWQRNKELVTEDSLTLLTHHDKTIALKKECKLPFINLSQLSKINAS